MNAVMKPDDALSGIAYGLPDGAYFAHQGLNKSTLTAFATLADQEPEQSAAMALGSLTHCAILQPELIGLRYVRTDVERRGTREWREEEESAGGRELVKASDWDAAMLMAESVRSHSEAMEILTGAHTEVSVFWTDPETGLYCKCRPDILGNHLADIKTCQSATARNFAKDIADRHYHWQEAWYLDGLRANGLDHDRMVFIAIEKKAKLLAGSLTRRHQIGLFECSAYAKQKAIEQVEEWRRVYAYSTRTGEYPEYPRTVQIVDLPGWANFD